MDTQKLHDLIDKVIGKSGPLRTPAWWMRRVLRDVVDKEESDVAALEKKTDNSIKAVDKSLTNKIDSLQKQTEAEIEEINPRIESVESFIDTNRFAITKSFPEKREAGFVRAMNRLGSYNLHVYVVVDGNMHEVNTNSDLIRYVDSIDFTPIDGKECISHLDFTYADPMASVKVAGMTKLISIIAPFKLTLPFFKGCSSLRSADLSLFSLQYHYQLDEMFQGCASLKAVSLDGDGFTNPGIGSANYMFDGCTSLEYLDFGSFSLYRYPAVTNILRDCKSLKDCIMRPRFFSKKSASFDSPDEALDLSDLESWTNGTVIKSLVEDSYDNSNSSFYIRLHPNTYGVLTQEHLTIMEQKGYIILVGNGQE